MGPSPAFTRDDFLSRDDYLRALREGGFEPTDNELRELGKQSGGPEANLARAVLGWTLRQTEYAWAGRGQTESIKGSDFRKAYNAVAFSNRLGAVMNVHATIVWETVGIKSDLGIAKAARDFLELYRKWCGERQLPCHWVHVLERGKRNGLHSHILASVPHLYKTRFSEWAHSAIKTVSGSDPVIKGRRRAPSAVGKGPHTINIVHRRDDDVVAQWELFKYPMKGVSPDLVIFDAGSSQKSRPLREVAGLHCRDQGRVVTKRVGTARAIGQGKQNEQGFCSAFDLGATSPAELYNDRYFQEFHADRQRREVEAVVSQLEI